MDSNDILAVTPRLVSEFREDIPVGLSDVVAKLLAKNAEERYQGQLSP